jgi:hypothetical protein
MLLLSTIIEVFNFQSNNFLDVVLKMMYQRLCVLGTDPVVSV